MVRPTGFEPAAYRVGVIRPSKKKPRFYAGFRYIPQIQSLFTKTVEAFGTPGLPRFFWFLENSSQTVVRGRAERKIDQHRTPNFAFYSLSLWVVFCSRTLFDQWFTRHDITPAISAVSERSSSTHSRIKAFRIS